MAKTSVNDVASFFIALAQDAGEQLTHMKLQKLIYYSQAWYLGMYGEPLFASSIEAWKHGPVCPEIYHSYKKYGNENIPFIADIEETEDYISIVEGRFSVDVIGFLNKIADDYMNYSALELSRMTHKEDPWLESISTRSEIKQYSMQDYYSELVIDEIEIQEINNGCREIEGGNGVEWKPGMFS